MQKIAAGIMILVMLFSAFAVAPVKADAQGVLYQTYAGDLLSGVAKNPMLKSQLVNISGTPYFYVASGPYVKKLVSGSLTNVAAFGDGIYSMVVTNQYIFALSQFSSSTRIYRSDLDGSNTQYYSLGTFNPSWSEPYISNGYFYAMAKINTMDMCILKVPTSLNSMTYVTIGSDQYFVDYLKFVFPIANSSNVGYLVFSSTKAYVGTFDTTSNAATTTTCDIGSYGFSDSYPVRIIHNSLRWTGTSYAGAVSVMGAPSSGSGIFIYNFYYAGGTWSWESRQYSPSGYDFQAKGCIWAYHINDSALGVSYYKTSYTNDFLYTAVLSYESSGRISEMTVNVNTGGISGYPFGIAPVFIFEDYAANTDNANYTSQWYYKHGYYPYKQGDYRVEYSTYLATTTTVYTLTKEQAISSSAGGGTPTGDTTAGGLGATTVLNMSNNMFYYFKQYMPHASTITKISALLYDENVNDTNCHSFMLAAWVGNTLEFAQAYNTSYNGTAVYYEPNIAITVPAGSTVRVGVIPMGDNLLGRPLGIGTSITNPVSYMKNVSCCMPDSLANVTFTYEGSQLNGRCAISFDYSYSEGGSGSAAGGSGGSSTTTSMNGSININANASSNINGSIISPQTTPVGTAILNAFNDWGYGAYAGGVIIWISLLVGFALVFSKVGGSGLQALLTGLVASSALCFGIGLIDMSIFVLSCLLVVVLASKEIAGYVRGGE